MKTGVLLEWFATILGLSVLNGFAEELLFRGLLLIPLVGLLGSNRGNWFQAAFFGFHHWGASSDIIAGLPMAIILTLLGVLFGKSVLATRGISWAIVFHIFLDIASLSSHLPLGH